MADIRDKDIEQAAGGLNIVEDTAEELMERGFTKHEFSDPVDNCPEFISKADSLPKRCASCRHAAYPTYKGGLRPGPRQPPQNVRAANVEAGGFVQGPVFSLKGAAP